MLLLDSADHDTHSDPWPWGGEPIFRNGEYVGRVTTAAYGFSIHKHVCLGFVHNYGENREQQLVTSEWVKSGDYEVEIGGLRFPVDAKLTAPVLPSVHLSRSQHVDTPTKHEVEDEED